MQEYDIALKHLFRESKGIFLRSAGGRAVVDWFNAELPEIRIGLADLLGLTDDGGIVQFEFQSTNDPRMALRMAEYNLAIDRRYDQFARRVVLYVGRSAMNMSDNLTGVHHQSSYSLIDMRTVDGERLMASSDAVGLVLLA